MVDTVINKRKPMGFGEWVSQIFIHPSISQQYSTRSREERVALLNHGDSSEDTSPKIKNPSHLKPRVATDTLMSMIDGSFRETFVDDGYEVGANTVVTFNDLNSQGREIEYERSDHLTTEKSVVHRGQAIAAFLGLPHRFEKVGDDGQLVYNGWTIAKDLVGGWWNLFEYPEKQVAEATSRPATMKFWTWKYVGGERGLWQIAALPIKFGIILPIKVALVPVKFALNVAKLVLEQTPRLLVNLTGKMLKLLAEKNSDTWNTNRKKLSRAGKALRIVFNVILMAPIAAIHYVSRVLELLGTAFLSPQKLVTGAWNSAHQVVVRSTRDGKNAVVNERATWVLQKLLGIGGALLAIALTAALWSIALPFAIASVVKHVPQFMVAVNWVLSTPFIAPALAYVNGVLTVVGGYLSIFLPMINTFAASMGLQVTAQVVAVGVSLASIGALILPILSRIADKLSNWWAMRPANSGPWSLFRSLTKGVGARRSSQQSKNDPENDKKLESEPKLAPAVVLSLEDVTLQVQAIWSQALAVYDPDNSAAADSLAERARDVARKNNVYSDLFADNHQLREEYVKDLSADAKVPVSPRLRKLVDDGQKPYAQAMAISVCNALDSMDDTSSKVEAKRLADIVGLKRSSSQRPVENDNSTGHSGPSLNKGGDSDDL